MQLFALALVLLLAPGCGGQEDEEGQNWEQPCVGDGCEEEPGSELCGDGGCDEAEVEKPLTLLERMIQAQEDAVRSLNAELQERRERHLQGVPEFTAAAASLTVSQTNASAFNASIATPYETWGGCWQYGDMEQDLPGVVTARDCLDACDAHAGCFHWNFHLTRKRCDLKKKPGGHATDHLDWVMGHSQRYIDAMSTR